jgi:hypothetical protein
VTGRITAVGSAALARGRRDPSGGPEARQDAALLARACEHVAAELFGGSPLEHGSSIYAQLCALEARCDPTRADFAALSPSLALDRCLGRLVEIVRGRFDSSLSDRSRSVIAATLACRIAGDPALEGKAHAIRRVAGIAEAQMEHHFSASLRHTLAARSRPPEGVRDPARALRAAFTAFPYFDSYARLIRAEVALLEQPVVPLFVQRDRALELAPSAGRLLAELQVHCAEALGSRRPAPLQVGGLAGKTIAICGCGPLPLTGMLFALATGAHVVLIDRDPRALREAAALVRELQRVGVLPADAFTMREADAGELDYGPEACSRERHVACDVVLVASLVPHTVKLRIAQRVREASSRTPLALVLRSATGLCAELAYEPVRTEQISGLGLVYCGQSAPWEARSSAERAATRAAFARPPELRVVAHPSVLNTSELYVRTPCALTHDPLGAAPWPWSAERIEHGIRLLRA